MALQSSLWFAPVNPTVVPTPAAGYFAVFISDGAEGTDAGRVYKKSSTGLITSVSGDENQVTYTDENARDAVGAILQNSGSIQLTYDDDLNFISATIIDGSIGTQHLTDAAVTTVKLIDAAVTADKVASNAITNDKLADNAVSTAEIATGAVTSSKLMDGAITNGKLADNAVSNSKLDAGAVTSSKLADNAVSSLKLSDAAVTNTKIAPLAVNTGNLADAAVTAVKLADGTVTAIKLGTDAVTQIKIADAAVGTAELIDGNVTNAKLASMAAGTIKMRPTGTAGAPTDATLAAVKTALAITAADVSGLGTAATMAATAFDAAGAATAAQAASQPLDADLSAIAALSTTAYGRSLLTHADAAATTALLANASTTLKGLMSPADKARLDNLHVGVFNVLNHGIAPGNTPAANLAAWNTLMGVVTDNATVLFPPQPAAYQFSGTLSIPTGKHLRVAGSSNQKSIIATTSATADIFAIGDWYNEFFGLKFTSTVTRTAGAAITSGDNVAINVYDCDFAGMYDGIVYTGGVNAGNLAVVSNCGFTATTNRGIVLDGTNANTIIDKVVMDGAIGVQQVGLELNQCGSVLVSNCDFIRAQNNLRFNPTNPGGVFSTYFNNVFFDTSSASSVLFTGTGNTQRVKFTNCWFSGSVTGCEFASTATTLPTAIDFINCDIFGNSSRGIWAHGVQDFNVTNCRIAGNTTAGVETSASAGAVTKFNLANNSICPTAGFGANGVGILINAGTYGGYAIKNNDLRNNATNNLSDAGTVATTDLKIVNDNFGHIITGSIGNLGGTAATSGTSTTALLSARVPARAASAGQVFRFRLIGVSSTLATVTFRVYVGSSGTTSDTQVWQSVTSGTQAANQRAGFDGTLTVRLAGASGTVQCEALGFAQTALLPTVVAAVTTPSVNTTNPWFITLAATVSGGTFTAHQAVVEAL